ncbi:MAG: hypothetical protein DRH12_19190 [Deltaproteobacteria bacterium]|nr:MAG: hypothetical protein DRH12_19190 [Deltaproteobacteria bacterium]
MTEGPTARLRAIQISDRFLGKKLSSVKIRSKRVYIDPKNLVGKRLQDTSTYGKNILLNFEPYGIRIHLMMYGSIRFEEEFSKPENRIRLILDFESGRMVVYNAPIVEVDFLENIEDRLSKELGIDPFRNWDEEKLFNMLIKNGDRVIGEVLLDQSVFAGVGNILRNEILFRSGIRPDRRISDIPEKKLKLLIRITKRLCEEFLDSKLKGRGIKSLLTVYNRKYCGRCGDKISYYRDEFTGRKTFFCPNCQS